MLDKPGQKTYGLSFPTKKAQTNTRNLVESVFNTESDDESEQQKLGNTLKPMRSVKNPIINQAKLHRKTKSDFEKAMEQDPSVFQYDEIYDDIKTEKDRQFAEVLSDEKKKSKYVGRLMHTAAERKLERELCSERKAQREIEAEAELYGTKETYVTSAYKEKLNERQELVAKRKLEKAREDVMDVTKQDGLGGFYRFMYQHGTAGVARSLEEDGDHVRSVDRKPSKHELHHKSPATESSRQRKAEVEDTSRSDHFIHTSRPSHVRQSEASCSQANIDKNDMNNQNPDDMRQEKSAITKQPVPQQQVMTPRDPNYIYARPRLTTDAQVEEARQRYLARKAKGVFPTIADSDTGLPTALKYHNHLSKGCPSSLSQHFHEC